jgi:hypothetical protein
MRRTILTLMTVGGLAACAQPEPIVNYDLPYAGKFSAPPASIRPEPRPAQRRWLACPNAAFNDDCGNGETDASTGVDEPDPVDRPDLPAGPARPSDPVAPDPGPAPDTPVTPEEPPAPEPEEPHEPPPETHEPPPVEEECPA